MFDTDHNDRNRIESGQGLSNISTEMSLNISKLSTEISRNLELHNRDALAITVEQSALSKRFNAALEHFQGTWESAKEETAEYVNKRCQQLSDVLGRTQVEDITRVQGELQGLQTEVKVLQMQMTEIYGLVVDIKYVDELRRDVASMADRIKTVQQTTQAEITEVFFFFKVD